MDPTVSLSPEGRNVFFPLHNLSLEKLNIFYVRHVIFAIHTV
jgi:hypothetical protein